MSELHRIERGQGFPTLLIHGSAVDHAIWSVTLRDMCDTLRMVAYDRRGTTPEEQSPPLRVEDHARDAAVVLETSLGEPALVIGASFGGVIALELARSRPELVRGLALLEPPLPPSDLVPSVAYHFGCHYDALIAAEGGESAADLFLRIVLGEEAVEKMPPLLHQHSVSFWRQIRADSWALASYRVRYSSLAEEVRAPTLLFAGDRSAPQFRDTLDALRRAIPQSEVRVLQPAGHMLHVDARRSFAQDVGTFCRALSG